MFIPVAFVSQLMFYSCIRSDYNRVKCRCSGAISNRVLTGAATIPLIIKVISRWLIHNSYIVYSRPNSTLTTVYFYSIWNTSLEVLHTGPWKWDNKSQFCIFSVTLIYLFFLCCAFFFQTTARCAVWTETLRPLLLPEVFAPNSPTGTAVVFATWWKTDGGLSVLKYVGWCSHSNSTAPGKYSVVLNSGDVICGSDDKYIIRWIYNNNLGSSVPHNVVTAMRNHVLYSEGRWNIV